MAEIRRWVAERHTPRGRLRASWLSGLTTGSRHPAVEITLYVYSLLPKSAVLAQRMPEASTHGAPGSALASPRSAATAPATSSSSKRKTRCLAP